MVFFFGVFFEKYIMRVFFKFLLPVFCFRKIALVKLGSSPFCIEHYLHGPFVVYSFCLLCPHLPKLSSNKIMVTFITHM